MSIKKFDDFVNEAYLKGSRQPLYHYTNDWYISNILKDDVLKMGRVARPRGTKAICLTRNPYFTHDGGVKTSPRIVLDYDKLIRDGYRSYPIDEIGIAVKDLKRNKVGDISANYMKSNFKEIKSGKRGTKHGLNLPKNPSLETEFEERVYRDIKKLGNYIISIDFSKNPDSISSSPLPRLYQTNTIKNELKSYLDKYPHIVVNIYDVDYRHRVTDITTEITNDEKIKLLNP